MVAVGEGQGIRLGRRHKQTGQQDRMESHEENWKPNRRRPAEKRESGDKSASKASLLFGARPSSIFGHLHYSSFSTETEGVKKFVKKED